MKYIVFILTLLLVPVLLNAQTWDLQCYSDWVTGAQCPDCPANGKMFIDGMKFTSSNGKVVFVGRPMTITARGNRITFLEESTTIKSTITIALTETSYTTMYEFLAAAVACFPDTTGSGGGGGGPISPGDITAGGAAIGDVLKWNGLNWVPSPDLTGSGSTNLGVSNVTATTLDVTSDTGTDATIPAATSVLAGLMSAADKTKLDSDNDQSNTNEIQTLSFSNPNLSITSGNSVNLSALNTDAQTLSFVSPNLSITGGNSVNLSSLLDNTDAQQIDLLDLTGLVLSISLQGDGQVPQTVTFTGWDNNASDDFSGAWSALSGVPVGFSDNVDNVDDADASPTNEIQNLSYSAATGTISISGGTGATVSVMAGATGGADGERGLVPKPVAGDNVMFLRGDGTWANPTVGGDNWGSQVVQKDATLTGDGTGGTPLGIATGGVGPTQLASTAVTPGSYTLASITVDADGRVTAAANGTESQDLSLSVNTLSLTGDVTTVDLSGYLDNTDAQGLTITGASAPFTLDISGGSDVNVDAGTGISLSESPANTLVITNSAPDQTVALSSGTGINVTGTYPNFTITNTSTNTDAQTLSWNGTTGEVSISGGNTIDIDGRYLQSEVDALVTNEGALTVNAGTGTTSIISSNTSGSTDVTLTAGTGLGIAEAGNVITLTNSAPDQTVSIASGTGINVTGTYPSFTVTNTGDLSTTNEIQDLSYTASTGAIGISGGGTGTTIPVMAAASAGVDGERGLVGKPVAGDQAKFWRADGTWANPSVGGDNWGTQVVQKDATLTGDGTGATPLGIATNGVGNTQMADNAIGSAEIINASILYADIQNISATDKVLGRVTAGAGPIEEITMTAAGRALMDDATAADQRTTLGLGTLATQNGTFSGTSSGTNTGDQTITLTSDVTGSGTGSFATTIAADAVTNSKLANMATQTFKGRTTAGTGDPEDLTVAQAQTLLGTSGTNTGDVTLAGALDYITIAGQTITRNAIDLTTDVTGLLPVLNGGTGSSSASGARANLGAAASGANTDITSVYLNNTGLKVKDTDATHGLSIVPGSNLTADHTLTIVTGDADRTLTLNGSTTLSGTNTGDQTITLTGDVTGSGTGSFAATIANSAVTYAKIQNVSATDKVLGRSTAGAGVVEEITMTAAGRALVDDIDAAAQRTTLGLGTMAVQASNSVSISGGSITGITDLAVADGGTGASDAATARTNLGAAASGANTDITSVYLNNTGLKVKDTNASHGLTIAPGSDITADRTLTVVTGDVDRTLTLSGSATISGTNTGDQTISAGDGGGTDRTINLSGSGGTVTLNAGSNISLARTGNTITIASTAGSGNYQTMRDNGTDETGRAALNFVNTTDANLILTDDGVNGETEVTIDIPAQAIDYAEIQNVSATDRVLGRSTAGAGTIEEIPMTAAGRALIDDVDAAAQRTTMGLGTIATQAANSVSISGGTITGITDLAVADGGTGASDAATARTNLGAAASGANTDITSVYLNNTGLKVKDTNASHGLTLAPGSDITADRTLTIVTGDADRTLTLNGSTTLSGTNTGDQTITLTGDVTGSGTGSFAATIANSAVTLAKMENRSTQTFIGRNTAGTGVPEELSVATAKTMLSLTGTNSGDQTITLTGDVTGSGTGSFAATVAADAVTNTKLANMATATFKGRTTAGTGDPEDLNATQATALLNNVVGDAGAGGTKGLVPAPAAGDAAGGKFLKADGTWTAPTGGAADLTFSGASSPVTLASSTGTDVVLTAGTNISFSQSANNLTINGPASATNFSAVIGYVEGVTGTSVDLDALDGNTKNVDGTNLAFDIPSATNNFKVYKNGVELNRTGTGTTRDYSVNDVTNVLTLTTSLATTDRLIVQAITGSAVDLTTSGELTGTGTSGSPLKLAQQSATTGQALAWSGTAWVPTTVGAGNSVISPTQITSDQDNYNPTGFDAATLVRVSSDAFRAITSFAAQSDGEEKLIANVGSFPIYLPGQHPDGTAANRIITPYDYMIYPGKIAKIVYDNTAARWIIAGSADFYRKGTFYDISFGSTTAGDWGNITMTSNGTAAASGTAVATANVPGALTGSTGSTNAGMTWVQVGKTFATQVYFGSSHISAWGSVSLPVLSDGTETYTMALQLTANPTSASIVPNNTVGIRYTHGTNAGKWQGYSRDNAGTESTVDLGVTVAATTLYGLRIELDKQNSEVRFYVDGVMAGRVTGNMPTANPASVREIIAKSAGTTSRTGNFHNIGLQGIY